MIFKCYCGVIIKETERQRDMISSVFCDACKKIVRENYNNYCNLYKKGLIKDGKIHKEKVHG